MSRVAWCELMTLIMMTSLIARAVTVDNAKIPLTKNINKHDEMRKMELKKRSSWISYFNYLAGACF